MGIGDSRELRQCALAVSVLFDLDVLPADSGVVLPGLVDVSVSWQRCLEALRGAEPGEALARGRLARWLRASRLVADRPLDELAENARPVGLPANHPLHPGPDWVRQTVPGDALDLGIGFVALDADEPDDVLIVPQGVLDDTRVNPEPWWPDSVSYLENMGAMAAVRWRNRPRAPLRPMGDCDVATLLGSAVFRHALCADFGGMRAVAVPMRTRGWLDPSRIDPAFVVAAAAATDDDKRGFDRPLLVTRDEVVMAPAGGHPAEIVLRDDAPAADRSGARFAH